MGLFFAWATGEGIIVWRWVKAKTPPAPGALLLPTALYLSLAILAEYRPARPVAVTFAWAVNLAILLNVIGKDPQSFGGPATGQLATGWPPLKIPDTQIWPGAGGAVPAAASTATKQSPAARAGSAASRTAQIIQKISQYLPGFGFLK